MSELHTFMDYHKFTLSNLFDNNNLHGLVPNIQTKPILIFQYKGKWVHVDSTHDSLQL